MEGSFTFTGRLGGQGQQPFGKVLQRLYTSFKRRNESMRKVSIDQLEPGMVLERPILRGSTVFLGKGVVLGETAISRLRSMEIEHAFVEGSEEQPISRDEAMTLLDERFRNKEDDPLLKHIKNLVREHIAGLYD
jgi:hypothetical protein